MCHSSCLVQPGPVQSTLSEQESVGIQLRSLGNVLSSAPLPRSASGLVVRVYIQKVLGLNLS